MIDVPIATEAGRIAQARGAAIQRYAMIAGVLFLMSIVAGGFGEFFVPSRLIVSGDATATANNIRASASLFRMGFAGYLVEATCDVALTLVLYVVLLRPVRKDLALLAAFFRLVSTAIFGTAELFYFAASVILGGADYLKTFSPDQRTLSRCSRSSCTGMAVGSSWCSTESRPFSSGI